MYKKNEDWSERFDEICPVLEAPFDKLDTMEQKVLRENHNHRIKYLKSFIAKELETQREQIAKEIIKEIAENMIPSPRIKLHYFQEQFSKENEGVKENNEELKGWNELRRLQIKAFEQIKAKYLKGESK